MGEFKPTDILSFSKSGAALTDEELYWQSWQWEFDATEGSCVVDADVNPRGPSYCVFACSSSLPLYDCSKGRRIREVAKCKFAPLGVAFRADGQLLAIADETSRFRVLSTTGLMAQRHFKGHSSTVRACLFTAEGFHLASFSDDFHVKFWDLATSTELHTLQGHTDSVRCGICRSSELIVSGSYDRTVRLWDTRQKDCVQCFDHGYPVECVALDRRDQNLIVGGGSLIGVWDFRACRRISQLSRHHKTVTRVRFCSNDTCFMSASLDHHLKVYDMQTLDVISDVKYPDPILSLCIRADNSVLAVGTSSGRLFIKCKNSGWRPKLEMAAAAAASMSTKVVRQKNKYVVKKGERKRFQLHDRLLMSFQYHKLVSLIMKPSTCEEHPEVVVSIFLELIRRNVLTKSLTKTPEETVLQILTFLTANVRRWKFTGPLLEVASVMIDLYCPKVELMSPVVREKFVGLLNVLREQVEDLRTAIMITGSLQSVLL